MTASTRRAALGALAGASVLTLPAAALAAAASAGHADADLFALRGAIEATDHRYRAALGAQSQAERAEFAARPPSPAKPESFAFMKEEWFLTFKEKMGELNANPNPSPEWAAYDAAVQAWQDEIDRVDLKIGASAASRARG